jgi:hypothetical protein
VPGGGRTDRGIVEVDRLAPHEVARLPGFDDGLAVILGGLELAHGLSLHCFGEVKASEIHGSHASLKDARPAVARLHESEHHAVG